MPAKYDSVSEGFDAAGTARAEHHLFLCLGPDCAPIEEGELIDLCRRELAGYKKPSGVVFTDQLPRNAAGKILKRNLREQYADHFTTAAP